MDNNPSLDLGSMLRQAQKLSDEMASRQAELAARRYEGTAGGGLVKAVMVDGRIVSVSIDASVTDDLEMLSDLITAAVNNVLEASGADNEKAMGELTGGLDLGGLLS